MSFDSDISVVYNSDIDEFVKIKSFSSEELTSVVGTIGKLIRKPGVKMGDYIIYLIRRCIVDYQSYDYVGDADSLFACIVEVYPILQVEFVCRTLNEIGFATAASKNSTPIMTMSGIEKVKRNIKKNIIGQDEAVEECMTAIKLIATGMSNFLSLFFIGPTGVGKTELAKLVADKYLGSRDRLLKINGSEYANGHEYAKLIGSPPGYIGHAEKGILTEKASESSEWVILFDEIEKAHPKLINLLLGLLDDGTIVDNQGVELDFSNSIIIFTSNVGIQDNVGHVHLGFSKDVKTAAASREDIEKEFKNEFSPEFINRLNSVVYFNSLTYEDAVKIAAINLRKLPIKVTKSLASFVAKNSFSVEYGARNINRFITNAITLKIADKILETGEQGRYKITVKNGTTLVVSDI